MQSQYGWLKVYGEVDHPFADKHDGHIYIHKQDILNKQPLVAGVIVTFYLYVDSKGLGAEACSVDRSSTSYNAAVEKKWHGESSWGESSWVKQQGYNQPQPTADFQPGAMYYNPYGCGMTTNVSSQVVASKAEDPAELPSVGSAGHFDGSCKRCAFFPKGRCQNGADCTHCHFDHSKMPRVRRQNKRKERLHQQSTEIPELIASEDTCPSSHDSDDEEMEPEVPHIIKQTLDVQCASEGEAAELETEAPDEQVLDVHMMQKLKEQCAREGAGEVPRRLPSTRAPSTRAPSDSGDRTPAHSYKSSPHESSSDSECASPKLASFHLDQTFIESDRSSSPSPSRSTFAELTPSPKPSRSDSGDLTPSPTSWAAQRRLRRAGTDSASKVVSTEELACTVRALLNKLTHDKFESLCSQILALPISTPEHVSVLAAEIFDKAATQEGFRPLYTELCIRIDAYLAEKDSVIGGKVFRKALVSECQTTFERYLQPADPSMFLGRTPDECFEVETKLKTRRLGNMGFIGDLLVRKLLAQKLFLPILHELLNGDEAALESLVALLTIVAPVFEQKASLHQACIRDAFSTLRRKRTEKGLSFRMKCKLSDLMDARAKGWTA